VIIPETVEMGIESGHTAPVLNAVRIWIVISTLLVSSGWVLSVLHQLNRAGYGVIFTLAIMVFVIWQWRTRWRPSKTFGQLWGKFRKRFKRPAPLIFLALTIMCFAGGALYVTENNDSNEYRIPRVWHWLAEGRWHWIHTLDLRMNVTGCNFEWLVAPIMLFTRYDRFIYLANWIPYLLLPGLVFSVFTRLGVRPRVAWWWMWLMPSAWCFVFQAASTVNDSFGVIYALASVDLALRAREKNHLPDMWLSILAIALLTGAKQTIIPLILPGLAAVILCLPMAMRRGLATAGVCLMAALVSAVPLFVLTFHNTGRLLVNSVVDGSRTFAWSGSEVPPFWGFIGNIFVLTVQNLHPPVFPWADRWNAAMQHFVQTPFGSHFSSFECFALLANGASESNAGIGLWIFLLVGVSICAARYYRNLANRNPNDGMTWLRWVPYVSLVIFMAKDGFSPPARQLASYYPLLFPAFLAAQGHGVLVYRRWWQTLVLTSMLLTTAMVVVARDRPMFPAETILAQLMQKDPQSHLWARVWKSYACLQSVEAQRHAFQNEIPSNEAVLGYATVRGAQEPGKWVPFGCRRVVRVFPSETPAQLRAENIHYVLLDSESLNLKMSVADWTNRLDAVLIGSTNFEKDANTTVSDYLVRLNPPGEK
jgi:hypothetical protein